MTWVWNLATAYVVCISVSLGFPYMVFISLGYPYYRITWFSYIVMLHRYSNENAIVQHCYELCIVPGASTVTSQWYGRYCFMEYARTWEGHLITPWQREVTTITGYQPINVLQDFVVICYIFLWNKSTFIIRRICREGTVLGYSTNKCSGLRPSNFFFSWWLGWRRHTRMCNQLFFF